MRKLFIALITVVAVGLVGSLVVACPWDGYWGEPMGNTWGNNPPGMNNSGSYWKFMNETAELRGRIAARRGEYNALMAQPNPDPKRAGELSREITELHDQLKAKAQAYDLPSPGYRGNGRNYPAGPYHGYCGWGRMGCW